MGKKDVKKFKTPKGKKANKKINVQVDPEPEPPKRKKRRKQFKNQPITSRGTQKVGGFTVTEFQRLPKQLLHEYCQKQKLQKPRYVNSQCDTPGKKRRRVVIPHKNDKEKDKSFVTREAFASTKIAEEHSALLALHHFGPKQPLERRLPEPFKTVWLGIGTTASKINTASKHTTKREKRVANTTRLEGYARERNRREAKKLVRKLYRVRMEEELRIYVENILNNNTNMLKKDQHNEENAAEIPEILLKQVTEMLKFDGFSSLDADLAIKNTFKIGMTREGLHSKSVNHLMLILSEDQLPHKYLAGSVGVVVKQNYSKKHQFLYKMGFPRNEIDDALKQFNNDQYLALEKLFFLLKKGLELNHGRVEEIDEEREEEMKEILEDELSCLESMFDGFKLMKPNLWKINAQIEFLQPIAFTLYFYLPPNSQYPFESPIIYFQHPKIKISVTQQLIQNCLQFTQELIGSPMSYEITEWFSNNLESIMGNSTGFFFRPLTGMWWEPVSVKKKAPKKIKKKKKKKSNMQKERIIKNDPDKSDYLLYKFEQQQENRDYKSMQYIRKNLPAAKQEEKIMDIINKNQVLVISGETGCGKSTQIPQFILDDALKNGLGSACNIVCTQPRRISAIGLAERVSSERAEKVGETVGYNIRLENKTSKQTQITYCTCGILLRRLSFCLNIGRTSHVVVDEVHERSVEIDILLKLLRDLLRHRKDLKVVLMSATLNAKVFSEYFDGAPVMHIPGRTFPVETHFLNDILIRNPRFKLKRATWIKRTREEERMRCDNYVQGGMPLELATQLARYDEGEQHKVDLDLVTVCVRTILEQYDHDLGAILIFMPGTWEINTCCRNIEKRFGRDYDLWVLPLHSSLSTKNQKQIFRRPPRGTRKIVISTNIAETSITVDDVKFVIDTGKMKEVQYDPQRKLQQLVETWCAGANAVQRRGRAGRVAKGICFHLYTEDKFDSFPGNQLPEIHRSSLEHVCLQLQFIRETATSKRTKGALTKTIAQTIEPPPAALVSSSIHELQILGALNEDENLTPLGHHLSQLPVGDVRIGKLLIYGALFGCSNTMCTLGAIMGVRNPFLNPRDAREEARECKKRFYSGQSDFITILNAFNQWKRSRSKSRFCEENFLSFLTMQQIEGIRGQYTKAVSGMKVRGSNKNDDDLRIIQALLCACLYPNVVKVKLPDATYEQMIGGVRRVGINSSEIKFYEPDPGGRIFLHPSSALSHESDYYCPYVLYLSKMETSKLYMFDCCAARPYALLLFGGDVAVNHMKKLITIDGFIHFQCSSRVAALIEGLRKLLDSLLLQIFSDPEDSDVLNHPVIDCMIRCIRSDGIEGSWRSQLSKDSQNDNNNSSSNRTYNDVQIMKGSENTTI